MSKPKKDKLVSFVDGGFVIDTTVHVPGVRSRTLRGKPWITTSPTEIQMGCIRFTNDAMLEIIRCMALQLKSSKPIIHQFGDYGESSAAVEATRGVVKQLSSTQIRQPKWDETAERDYDDAVAIFEDDGGLHEHQQN